MQNLIHLFICPKKVVDKMYLNILQEQENVPMEAIDKSTRIHIDPPSSEKVVRPSSKMIRPRSHTTKNISRAKIKTVKLTVTVILAYIICSVPFILVQLWAVFGSPPSSVCKYWLPLITCYRKGVVI